MKFKIILLTILPAFALLIQSEMYPFSNYPMFSTGSLARRQAGLQIKLEVEEKPTNLDFHKFNFKPFLQKSSLTALVTKWIHSNEPDRARNLLKHMHCQNKQALGKAKLAVYQNTNPIFSVHCDE